MASATPDNPRVNASSTRRLTNPPSPSRIPLPPAVAGLRRVRGVWRESVDPPLPRLRADRFRGAFLFHYWEFGVCGAHSSGVETLLPWVRRLPAGPKVLCLKKPKDADRPPGPGSDLRWSSFLNNFEAGNSRVLSREMHRRETNDSGLQRNCGDSNWRMAQRV